MNKRMTVFFLTVLLTLPSLGVFAQRGVIKELSGTVELRLPGTQDFVAAKSGDQISQDTVISTGFKSAALVEVGSAVITVRPLTRLTLKEISSSAGSENLNMNLRTGRVRVELSPPAGTKAATSVSSPVATASVRGTKFDFDTRNLYVERGAVAFKGSRGGLVRVNADSRSQLDGNNKASYPVDTRDMGLRPHVPVGVASTGGSANSTGTQSSANLTITATYPSQ